jgi:hypothetical protein
MYVCFYRMQQCKYKRTKNSHKIQHMVKNTEFDDDFKFAEMVFNNCS